MLKCLNQWCNSWKICINPSKSKMIQFCSPKSKQNDFIFIMNETEIELVQEYKYLGMVLDVHLKVWCMWLCIIKRADRALSSVIAKHNVNNNFNFSTVTHLFNTCIIPVMLYGSEACSYNTFTKCDQIQYRAMRIFPILGLQGYMGWISLPIGVCLLE